MVEITEEEKINIKRDVACNAKELEDLKKKFYDRDPAKETAKSLIRFELAFQQISDSVKNIEKSLEEIKKSNSSIVSWKMFWTIITIYSVIIGSILSYGFTRVASNETRTLENRDKLTAISVKVENIIERINFSQKIQNNY